MKENNMDNPSKVRHIADHEVTGKDLVAEKPFKINEENSRRFVRLEISAPMSLSKLKDVLGGFWPQQDGPALKGIILNISAGGALVELEHALNEGDIVSMYFQLQEGTTLEGVLGLVKRCDPDSEVCLTGIEFVTRQRLSDLLSQAEMDMLPNDLNDFTGAIRETLGQYVSRRAVEAS